MNIGLRLVATTALAAAVLTPTLAFASFTESAERARADVAALSPEQLDALNTKVFSDAQLTAKIIGFDRAEIDQLKVDMEALRQENASLRAALAAGPTGSPAPASIEARMSKLEIAFESLQGTLGLVVKMLTALLTKLS